MGKSLQELGLKAAPAEGVDYDHIPEEFGPRTPPPYPGDYGFKLPGDLKKAWDVFEDAEKKQWVSLVFDDDNPLAITLVKSGDEAALNTNVKVRINNKPRNRGKEKIPVSDMTYLIRVLNPAAKPGAGEKDQAKLNQAFVNEMLKHGGKEFVANLEWQTNCNQKGDAYFAEQDEAGNLTGKTVKREKEGGGYVQGCGNRFYMNDWPKGEDGRYAPALTCACGAQLNPFAQLGRFRALVR